MRMARAAFEGLGPVEVQLDPHPFTVDALRGGGFGDALFILGADQAGAFESWKEPGEVLDWVKLAVASRARHPRPDLGRYGDRVVTFRLDSPDVSSTEVRRRVAAGEPISELVPPTVERVIDELGLYR